MHGLERRPVHTTNTRARNVMKLYVWDGFENGTYDGGVLFAMANDLEEAQRLVLKAVEAAYPFPDPCIPTRLQHAKLCIYGRCEEAWGDRIIEIRLRVYDGPHGDCT